MRRNVTIYPLGLESSAIFGKTGAFPVAFEGLASFDLYVHSYLGLGTTEAQRSLQTYLASQQP